MKISIPVFVISFIIILALELGISYSLKHGYGGDCVVYSESQTVCSPMGYAHTHLGFPMFYYFNQMGGENDSYPVYFLINVAWVAVLAFVTGWFWGKRRRGSEPPGDLKTGTVGK